MEGLKRDSAETISYAGICDSLGNLYINQSKYEMAEPILLEAKQIKEKVLGKESIDYASSCNDIGSLYRLMGKYEDAEPFLSEAMQIREKIFGKDNSRYAQSCNELAILYWYMGNYEKAEPLYLKAAQIWEKNFGKDHPFYAKGYNNLAVLYQKMGQYEKAEYYYLKAKEVKEKILGKEHPDYATGCNNLGGLYVDMGQYEKAEPLFLEAKQIREKVFGKEHPDYAVSCNNLGSLYATMGQYEKVEPLFLEAKQIREKKTGKEHPAYASSCKNLADLYTKTGQYEKAEPLYLEAKQIREKMLGPEHPDYTKSCIALGNLYWDMKKPEKANEFYIEAFESQNIQINKIFRFTSEAEQQFYLKTNTDLENYILSFNKSTYPHSGQELSYDISLCSRNLILSSSLQLRQIVYEADDTSIQTKYNIWINLREQLAFWYAKPVTQRTAYVKDLEQQTDSLEKELTRISLGFEKEEIKNKASRKNIQQALKPNEAAIEFVQFHFYNGTRWTDSTYYVALLLTKTSKEPEFIPLFESRQLNNIIKTGNSHKTITSIYKSGKANTAYNLIWKPIDKHLDGITKIYFASAGLLYRISLQALPVNDQQVLSDKYQLVQLNTTASLTDQSKNRIDTTDKIYLYGGIQYDVDSATLKQTVMAYHHDTEIRHFVPDDLTRGGSWQYLPGTEKEVNKIDSLGQQRKYTVFSESGNVATEESIKAFNGNASPVVLHIATHGFFFPDPKTDTIKNKFASGNVFRRSDDPLFRSGLLFAGANSAWQGKQIEGVEDGILTAYEASNLYLPNTKLVVLSACETGLGDIQGNEGVYGLQRAFKIAGVENLIMSLWKVPDKETAEFMELFYKNLFDKQSIEDAFYSAQTVMKNNYRKEPYKWAAWILVR
jgi:CHAT domain-containing protein